MVDTENNDREIKKTHHKPRAGRKAEKKKKKDDHIQDLTARERNPKAFALNSAIRAERKFRRHQDLDTKKLHIPLIDRTPLEPPPIVVAVVGPPKVGKTTLIKCLIKNFTRQPLTSIKGPVTVISGKRRRITLIECNNDINSMIDIAKIADLVFLMIDGSFGFEMEIFEFLNISQVHGMPKVMGILTHLDMFKNNETLKHTKKILKHRFWTEVYPGAKLFYLSGIMRGEYLRNEIERLARFISVMKFRPLTWQTSHSYVLVDRMEDLTSPEVIRQNLKCDRTVSLYGYVRGIPLCKNNNVHIPGCGDSKISDICFLPDPCPLPDKLKKRSLVDKEKIVYAPFSGVGGIVYDKDAVYVELAGSHSHKKENDDDRPEQQFVATLVESKQTLGAKLEQSEVQLFSHTGPIVAREFIDEQSSVDGREREVGSIGSRVTDDRHESDMEENTDLEESVELNDLPDPAENIEWKSNLSQKAHDAFVGRQSTTTDLWKLIYRDYQDEASGTSENEETEEVVDGLFKIVSAKKKQFLREKYAFNVEDCSRVTPHHMKDWSSPSNRDGVRDYFVTGKWNATDDANQLLKSDNVVDNSDDELFGDFVDFETGETRQNEENPQPIETEKPKRLLTKAEIMDKKRKLKEKFNAEYDGKDGETGGTYYDELKQDATKQAELNKTEFEGLDDEERVKLEGYRPGMYVRLELENMPCELVENFDPTYPLIVGGLQFGEENVGFVNVRIKKHRWYEKILKSKDPIIISLGWRKFQTVPVYYKLEDNHRQRMLKYTPEHVTCMANFWGPLTKPGTGFLAVQDVSNRQDTFRIIATGTVVDTNQSTQLTKKLKLIGEPLKIYKKTAFVKNMFNSTLEVAKFEGAKIRTVSGIRGQIKRACSKPEGVFRATFEDMIKLSDIIFCRTWCNVEVPKLYNPVTSLLSTPDEKTKWSGMKRLGQLKREKGVKHDPQLDSLYTDVHRKKKVPRPIKIPKRLQSQLPYKDKPKVSKMRFGNDVTKKRLAIVRDKHDHKVSSLLKMVRTNYLEKQGKLRREMKVRREDHTKQVKIHEQARQKREKEEKKRKMIKRTKREVRENK